MFQNFEVGILTATPFHHESESWLYGKKGGVKRWRKMDDIADDDDDGLRL
jgi:hypothetical protein